MIRATKNNGRKIFTAILLLGLTLILFSTNISALSKTDSYMTVRVSMVSDRKSVDGSIANDTKYNGQITTYITETIGYQSFDSSGSSSGMGGAYVRVYCQFKNYAISSASSRGTVTYQGKTLSTLGSGTVTAPGQ
ncbi:hypothetical protein AOC36_11700 (plasmid) [Erysipelothrix larvae]|uniref:Uncharacterized protein n=1 Tax=Erysipelothrix larvae TaxID=1514105 RepID=A0A0X8H2K5_9FIRM|nr:hypothetical protein [Erysipelothrix larvae]AMC94179.1 hypothetical protein AOC36_09305 [Erysipelothrix larvae]AMC94694.1 hypothetical protein AOC36_11700 [Erysipelothrix larvae]